MNRRDGALHSVDRGWKVDLGPDGVLVLQLFGSWRLHEHLPPRAAIEQAMRAWPAARSLAFDTSSLDEWDSGFVVFVRHALEAGRLLGLNDDRSGLPMGVRKLLDLAAAVPERQMDRSAQPPTLFAWLGGIALRGAAQSREMVTFLGEATLAFGRFLGGRARVRGPELLATIQHAGPAALGIVSLISFLMGVILAYVGAVQLRQFGAEIYMADLVGIAMVRQMAPIMTAIILAGRTGAAYAAQLGTMRVNEEIDAVQTMGISTFDFLVLPRMLALIVMMPLLTVYADIVGIVGGGVVAAGTDNVGLVRYWNRIWVAVHLSDIAVGLVSACVFGVLVAVSGCLRGLQSGRSSAAVGLAATSAVVTGIVSIVAADAVLTVVYDVLGL